MHMLSMAEMALGLNNLYRPFGGEVFGGIPVTCDALTYLQDTPVPDGALGILLIGNLTISNLGDVQEKGIKLSIVGPDPLNPPVTGCDVQAIIDDVFDKEARPIGVVAFNTIESTRNQSCLQNVKFLFVGYRFCFRKLDKLDEIMQIIANNQPQQA